MELKLNIGYPDLLELVKQLPASQLFQLKADLSGDFVTEKAISEKESLKALLLSGPVMSDEQFESFQENRKWMNERRTKK